VERIRGFRDRRVWQKAMDAAMLVSMASQPENWAIRKP
jgi:hypothetical protein